ncbi:helix-turn-helix domain-containing protein [Streptomyces lincolnensis]|nr:helix-turn-helix domain-containing protein [Streptomyces lincolnensis]
MDFLAQEHTPTWSRLVDALRSAQQSGRSVLVVTVPAGQEQDEALVRTARSVESPERSVLLLTSPDKPFRKVPACAWEGLSEAEAQIVELVRDGLTNRQIATRIHRSPHTVNYHLRRIFKKLSVASRVELAAFAGGAFASRQPTAPGPAGPGGPGGRPPHAS